ncbi:hypothetical protein ACQ4PT_057869 [Festuca glaucescens]
MSAAGHGRLSRSASSIVAKPVNGFHLLRIDGYSQTKTVLPGQKLSSQHVTFGGYSWRINYYPNGRDPSAESNAMSVYLQLIGHNQRLQARYKFSLLDHDGVAAYELPAETGSFTSVAYPDVDSLPGSRRLVQTAIDEQGPGCGHDDFIGTEELERREHLIRDDSILLRCDVGVAQIEESWLAREEPNNS